MELPVWAGSYLTPTPGSARAQVGMGARRRHALRGATGHFLGPCAEALRGFHSAGLAEQRVDQRAIAVNRALQIGPFTSYFYVAFAAIP